MMEIQEKVPLAPLTTLHVGGPAQYFVSVCSLEQLTNALTYAGEKELPVFILGGGSNICISDEGIQGLVIKNEILGIEIQGEEVTVGAGENWDSFVEKVVEEGLWGVENLSAIPGTVGATPIQNVGAYGVEVSHHIKWVEAVHKNTKEVVRFSNKECQFAYRDSFFKTLDGRNYIITKVCFILSRERNPKLSYKDIEHYFRDIQETPTLSEIRNAVIEIRSNKFPDYTRIGTAGSFFKMPIVPIEVADALQQKYPNMPIYPVDEAHKKVIIAWILDHIMHIKGFKQGKVGVYEKHSLVLVAEHGATATEIQTVTRKIITDIQKETGLDIETEVTFV